MVEKGKIKKFKMRWLGVYSFRLEKLSYVQGCYCHFRSSAKETSETTEGFLNYCEKSEQVEEISKGNDNLL
ncbi:hypothetical protein KHA80_10515 [Anaerobacillus sp. HL2]|nr:hypothetical protein KHA80_10515 [Anaerobacillus sp. HL2]